MNRYVFLMLLVVNMLRAGAQVSQSYNYSKIVSHPRLLLSEKDEIILKQSIVKNPYLDKIDKYVRQVSDSIVLKDPLKFKKEGKRLLAVSREALTRLYYLSYSYRITKNKKYLLKAEKELIAICDFESWNPSHFLDVAEICMGIAIAYDWLYTDLNKEIKQKVKNAILEKAFKPSYAKEYNSFLIVGSNWNSVCNAGLVYGALAIFEDEQARAIDIIERALKSNQLPLKTYAPDGNYPEGPGYWNYGTTFQLMLSAALESALGSDKGLSNSPGFVQSAYYMLFTKGTSNTYFNYSDCGSGIATSPSMFWFAKKTGDASLLSQEIPLLKNGRYTPAYSPNIDRTLPNVLVFGKDIVFANMKQPTSHIYIGRGITPVALVRTNWEEGQGVYLGIKGGSASVSHAHMDQGSFVYDVGDLRWAMDLGMQNYNSLESAGVDLWNKTQNSQRWEVFRYNNLNHNTLTVNNQRHNVAGKAQIIETYKSENELGAKVDLTPVLNLNNELKLATRKATIINNNSLKIEDVLQTNGNSINLRWNMVTPAKVKILDENTIQLSQKGKIMYLKFKANVIFKLVVRPSYNPSAYKCEFGDYNYASYNQQNKGTVMLGFDAQLPANTNALFSIDFVNVQ